MFHLTKEREIVMMQALVHKHNTMDERGFGYGRLLKPDLETNNHGYPTQGYLDRLSEYRATWAIIGAVALVLGLGVANVYGDNINNALNAALDAWSEGD